MAWSGMVVGEHAWSGWPWSRQEQTDRPGFCSLSLPCSSLFSSILTLHPSRAHTSLICIWATSLSGGRSLFGDGDEWHRLGKKWAGEGSSPPKLILEHNKLLFALSSSHSHEAFSQNMHFIYSITFMICLEKKKTR